MRSLLCRQATRLPPNHVVVGWPGEILRSKTPQGRHERERGSQRGTPNPGIIQDDT